MKICKTISEIRKELENGKKTAFIPTMGSLHAGHLSLVKKGSEIAENVVVSIFVNRSQFNDPSDYEKYPREIESDLEKLRESGATHVFAPEDGEIFLQNFSFKITPIRFASCLCGATRPGHFEGVSLIITKLFNIINPNFAIFGTKDFQQFLIIKRLITDLNFNIKILPQETMREKNGLAMSSRNQRLSEESKIKASNIFRILNDIKNSVKTHPENYQRTLSQKQEELLQIGFEKIDYLEIRDEENLEPLSPSNPYSEKNFRVFVAAYLEGVRLIDNIPIHNQNRIS